MLTNAAEAGRPAERRAGPAASGLVEPCGLCDARPFSVCGAMAEARLVSLARLATPLGFEPGATLVHAGDEAAHFFNVTAGTVRVCRFLVDGRRQVAGFLFPGDFLGLAARDAYAFTAESVTPVRACRFPRRAFRRLLEEFPALEGRLLGMASTELEAAQDQMLLLARKTAEERLASFLLTLSRRAARLGRPADPVSLPMSRTDIADHLGLTIETVSRTLTRLRTRGLIRMVGAGEVHLARRDAIEALAEGA